MTLPTNAARNALYLVGGEALARALQIVVAMIVARHLGSDAYGRFSVVWAYTLLFSLIASLGVDSIVVRQASRTDGGDIEQILGNALGLKLVLSLLATLGCWLSLWVVNYAPDLEELIALGALQLLFNFQSLFRLVFESRLKMARSAAVNVFGRMAWLVGALVLVRAGAAVRAFVLLFALMSIPELLLGLILARSLVRLRPKFDLRSWRRLLAESWPLALTGLFIVLYSRIDQLMLATLSDASAVGNYAAAVRIGEAPVFIAVAFATSVFPLLARFFGDAEDHFRSLYQLAFRYMASASIPIAVGLSWTAVPVVSLCFGAQFESAGPSLAVLIWSQVFIFAGIINQRLLVASHLQRYDLVFTGLSALVNILANLLLIPGYGIQGAAVATVLATASGTLLGFAFRATRPFSRAMYQSFGRPLLAALLMVPLWHLLDPSLWLTIASGAIVYLPALALLGGITRSDLVVLRRAVVDRRSDEQR